MSFYQPIPTEAAGAHEQRTIRLYELNELYASHHQQTVRSFLVSSISGLYGLTQRPRFRQEPLHLRRLRLRLGLPYALLGWHR